MAETDLGKWHADLHSPDVAVRAQAAEHLCLAGADAVPFAADLVQACGDAESVRQWTVAALEDLGPSTLEQLPRLIALLAASEATVAYWAATLVGRLGPAASSAESALTALLAQSKHEGARERAAWALEKIGVTLPATYQILEALSRDANPRLARLAAAALAHSPP